MGWERCFLQTQKAAQFGEGKEDNILYFGVNCTDVQLGNKSDISSCSATFLNKSSNNELATNLTHTPRLATSSGNMANIESNLSPMSECTGK